MCASREQRLAVVVGDILAEVGVPEQAAAWGTGRAAVTCPVVHGRATGAVAVRVGLRCSDGLCG